LNPPATPLSPVARPTAASGNRSVMEPYMLAETKLWPKIATLITMSETQTLATNGTMQLARHRALLRNMVLRRTLKVVTPRLCSHPAIQPPASPPPLPRKNGIQDIAPTPPRERCFTL